MVRGGALEELLARHAAPGADGVVRVRYAAWKSSAGDTAALDAWIAAEAARSPSAMARADAFAFWANLYNALTLRLVLRRYPVRSVRAIASEGAPLWDVWRWFGPWRTPLVAVEGRRLSLDGIEHGVMRPLFRDPRVHYALNCASVGCPDLRWWRAGTLDADLDAAAARFVNHPRGVSLLPDGRVRASSIYRWFARDFGGRAGVLEHLRRHAAAPALAAGLAATGRVHAHAYDWALNDAV